MSKPPESGRWLLLIASLPTEDPAARMRMLRTLESLGAAVIREGAYLLPDDANSRQGLEHLSEYIAKGAGSAQVLQVMPTGASQQEQRSGNSRSVAARPAPAARTCHQPAPPPRSAALADAFVGGESMAPDTTLPLPGCHSS